MSNVIGIFLIAYMFGITPILFGTMYHRLLKTKELSLAACYAKGMILMLGFFWVEAVAAIMLNRWLSTLAKYFVLSITILNVAAIILSGKQLVLAMKNWIMFLTTKNSGRIVVPIGGSVMLLSILLFLPLEDDVTEYAQAAVASNEMYVYHPYLNDARPWLQEAKHFSPFEMLYAIPARISMGDTAFLVKTILPIFMLTFFFTSMWEIGKKIFDGQAHVFFLFALLLVSYPLYTAGNYINGAILLNSWYGPCLLNCVIFPWCAVLGIELINHIVSSRKAKEIYHVLVKILLYVAVILAAQLMDIRGGYYAILIFAVALLIGVGRKGYNYVKSHDRG